MFDVWSWVLAAGGLLQLWLAGLRLRSAWVVGFVTSVLWMAFAFATGSWGFLVSGVIFAGVHVRNWVLWSRR